MDKGRCIKCGKLYLALGAPNNAKCNSCEPKKKRFKKRKNQGSDSTTDYQNSRFDPFDYVDDSIKEYTRWSYPSIGALFDD